MPVILQGLDPRVLAALRSIQAEAAKRGIQTNLLSAVRTPEDQKELFANFQAGRTGQPLPFPSRGAVPLAAAPGTSLHERGLAFDLQAADPSRQSELWSIAPSYGLKALGMRDPAHFELTDGGGAAPVAVAATPSGFLRELQQFESGGRNINNIHQGTSSGQAQGFNQITTGTWADFGGLKYAPNPQAATADQQNEIAFKIPMGRWAPETLDYLKSKGFTVDPSRTLGENIAMNGGAGGGSSGTSTASTGGSAPSNPNDWQALLGAEAPPGVSDLGSIFSGGAVGGTAPPSTGLSGTASLPPPPMTDFSFAPATDSPEAVGARYAQAKDQRKLSPLGQLFTLKTIGQPGGPKLPLNQGIG